MFWEVRLNGDGFSETMQPFSASDAWIERYGCTACGIPGCGSGWIAVRRAGGHVLWMAPPQSADWRRLNPGLLPGEDYWFAAEQYHEALGAGCVDDLPLLLVEEIRAVLGSKLPSPEAAIAKEPSSGDWSGEQLLRRVHQCLGDPKKSLQVAAQPPAWSEIIIHLDLPGFPQSRWYLGRSDQGLAVLFAANPNVPFWLSGLAIEQAFADALPNN